MKSEPSLDIEFLFVLPRELLDPEFSDEEIASLLMADLKDKFKTEINDGIQVHIHRISDGLIMSEEGS